MSVSSESKPQPCFSDLPWFIKKQIIEETDLITRFRLRRVSRDVLFHVDRSPLHFEHFFFDIEEDQVKISIGTSNSPCITIYYEEAPEVKVLRFENHDNFRCIEGPEPLRRAVRDLATLFASPRSTVKDFCFEYVAMRMTGERYRIPEAQFKAERSALNQKLAVELEKLPHQLNVQSFSMPAFTEEEVMRVLPFFKPGVISDMTISYLSTDKKLEKLHHTEQWKRAKHIEGVDFRGVPLLSIAHLKKTILCGGKLNTEDLKQFIERILERPDNFEYLSTMCSDYDYEGFKEYAMRFPQRYPFKEHVRFVPIPDTDSFLSIDVFWNAVEIERVTREELYKW